MEADLGDRIDRLIVRAEVASCVVLLLSTVVNVARGHWLMAGMCAISMLLVWNLARQILHNAREIMIEKARLQQVLDLIEHEERDDD